MVDLENCHVLFSGTYLFSTVSVYSKVFVSNHLSATPDPLISFPWPLEESPNSHCGLPPVDLNSSLIFSKGQVVMELHVTSAKRKISRNPSLQLDHPRPGGGGGLGQNISQLGSCTMSASRPTWILSCWLSNEETVDATCKRKVLHRLNSSNNSRRWFMKQLRA